MNRIRREKRRLLRGELYVNLTLFFDQCFQIYYGQSKLNNTERFKITFQYFGS